MGEKRNNWKNVISEFDIKDLVFLDESGVNTNMTRLYARAVGGKRAVDSVPLNTPANTTILSSVRLSGETVYTTYKCGTTSDKFKEYLENKLLPTLDPNPVIVMDNMRSHHAKTVTDFLNKSGVKYLYLPPYSPDLNPIEKLWSKIKAHLRKSKSRSEIGLAHAVANAFRTIQMSDCSGWFSSCGYSH